MNAAIFSLMLLVSLALSSGDRPQDEPAVKKQVTPFYPTVLKAAGIEGEVMVRVLVNEKGEVEKAEVVKSTHQDFNGATLEAAKQWIFTPASRDGKPIKAEIVIPFKFRLGEGSSKSRQEDLMRCKESVLQLVQGNVTKEILARIDPEAYVIIGRERDHLKGLLADKGKSAVLVEGQASTLVSSHLKTDSPESAAYLVLKTKPSPSAPERYHTVVLFKSEKGDWQIFAWHAGPKQ